MKRWIAMGVAVALLAIIAAVIPLFATARHAVVRDPNDTRGALDVRRVEMVSGTRWKVTTWRGWKTSALWDRGHVLIYLDTFGGARSDYYVLVGSNGMKMTAVLYRDRDSGKDRRIRSVRVRHPSKKVATVTVPLRKLARRESGVYEWYVLSLFSSKDCRRVCFDRAPNSGTVIEPGPRPSPTPTLPTPTVTPSP